MTASRDRTAHRPADPTTLRLRSLMAAVVAEARPDDDSEEVAIARGILAKTCAGCGADLDDAGRRDPQRLCPACRPASPQVA